MSPYRVGSVDEARPWRQRLIGVQLIGDDSINSPPAHLLAWRGYVQNVRGFSALRRLTDATPTRPAVIVDAVAQATTSTWPRSGDRIAGYFAQRAGPRASTVTQIEAGPTDLIPITFDISTGLCGKPNSDL